MLGKGTNTNWTHLLFTSAASLTFSSSFLFWAQRKYLGSTVFASVALLIPLDDLHT
jgi:hypothetical protein